MMSGKKVFIHLLNFATWIFLLVAGFLLLASGGIALDSANPAFFIWGIAISLGLAVSAKLLAKKLEGQG